VVTIFWLQSIGQTLWAYNTQISIRLAGIDAPETAHFGKPAQPGGPEALSWLKSFLQGRRVRCIVYKKDQYDRLVATVKVRRLGGLWRQDVGLMMLKKGLATVYEAKSGAVFGSAKTEEKYRRAEWWARAMNRGIWKESDKEFESPREFKNRVGVGKED
jgi:endonuclease YncB( thermonuclease family)